VSSDAELDGSSSIVGGVDMRVTRAREIDAHTPSRSDDDREH
jgi:hypothetical protein